MRTVIYLLEKRFIKGKPATQELIKGHSATCVYSEEEFTDKFENGELPPSHIFLLQMMNFTGLLMRKLNCLTMNPN